MNGSTSILGAKSNMMGKILITALFFGLFASGFPALAAGVTTKEPEKISIMPVM